VQSCLVGHRENANRPQLGVIVQISLGFKQLAHSLHDRIQAAVQLAGAVVIRISWCPKIYVAWVSAA
jgi:hypothetical protein